MSENTLKLIYKGQEESLRVGMSRQLSVQSYSSIHVLYQLSPPQL